MMGPHSLQSRFTAMEERESMTLKKKNSIPMALSSNFYSMLCKSCLIIPPKVYPPLFYPNYQFHHAVYSMGPWPADSCGLLQRPGGAQRYLSNHVEGPHSMLSLEWETLWKQTWPSLTGLRCIWCLQHGISPKYCVEFLNLTHFLLKNLW